MSSEETRRNRFFKLQKKRNPLAKEVLDRKGPYTEKVINPKKSEYKRVKIDPRDIESEAPMTTQRWRALLDSYSLTEILEEFDILEEEVLERLFVAGLIDEEILKNLEPTDVEFF